MFDDNDSNSDCEHPATPIQSPLRKKQRKMDPTIAQNKKDIKTAIDENKVDFQDDTTLPHTLLKQHCKWPFDKTGNPLKDGAYIVCRMPEHDNNGTIIGHCNTVYKYAKNGGFDSIHKHFKNKHKQQYNDWQSQQQPKEKKKFKYNTLSLKNVPVNKYKDKLAKILAKGVCKHFGPF